MIVSGEREKIDERREREKRKREKISERKVREKERLVNNNIFPYVNIAYLPSLCKIFIVWCRRSEKTCAH